MQILKKLRFEKVLCVDSKFAVDLKHFFNQDLEFSITDEHFIVLSLHYIRVTLIARRFVSSGLIWKKGGRPTSSS